MAQRIRAFPIHSDGPCLQMISEVRLETLHRLLVSSLYQQKTDFSRSPCDERQVEVHQAIDLLHSGYNQLPQAIPSVGAFTHNVSFQGNFTTRVFESELMAFIRALRQWNGTSIDGCRRDITIIPGSNTVRQSMAPKMALDMVNSRDIRPAYKQVYCKAQTGSNEETQEGAGSGPIATRKR